jgi:hypothetical protein
MVTQTKLVTQRELHLFYTSKKVISKLHKLTNYKSNYTSTIYKKVNASLCWEIQTNVMNKVDTMIFIPRFTRLPTR